MKRRTKRAARRAQKKLHKQMGINKPSGESRYGRKRAWLHSNGLWGFEVPEPKPWK